MCVTSVSIPNSQFECIIIPTWHRTIQIRHLPISSCLFMFTLRSAVESHLFSYKYHIWHVCIIPYHSISFNQIRMKSEMLHVTFVIFVDFGHMPCSACRIVEALSSSPSGTNFSRLPRLLHHFRHVSHVSFFA